MNPISCICVKSTEAGSFVRLIGICLLLNQDTPPFLWALDLGSPFPTNTPLLNDCIISQKIKTMSTDQTSGNFTTSVKHVYTFLLQTLLPFLAGLSCVSNWVCFLTAVVSYCIADFYLLVLIFASFLWKLFQGLLFGSFLNCGS